MSCLNWHHKNAKQATVPTTTYKKKLYIFLVNLEDKIYSGVAPNLS